MAAITIIHHREAQPPPQTTNSIHHKATVRINQISPCSLTNYCCNQCPSRHLIPTVNLHNHHSNSLFSMPNFNLQINHNQSNHLLISLCFFCRFGSCSKSSAPPLEIPKSPALLRRRCHLFCRWTRASPPLFQPAIPGRASSNVDAGAPLFLTASIAQSTSAAAVRRSPEIPLPASLFTFTVLAGLLRRHCCISAASALEPMLDPCRRRCHLTDVPSPPLLPCRAVAVPLLLCHEEVWNRIEENWNENREEEEAIADMAGRLKSQPRPNLVWAGPERNKEKKNWAFAQIAQAQGPKSNWYLHPPHPKIHCSISIAESATFACQTVSIFMDTTVTFFPNSFIYYNLFLFNLFSAITIRE